MPPTERNKHAMPHPTGFMVLHSNQLEGLRDVMVQFIQNNPLPPLAPEVLLVQSNGMKHWLELALARDNALGICAATQIELPSAQLWQIYRAVLGQDVVPAHMPLDKSPLVWRLMRRLPALLTQPVFEPLAQYLGQPTHNDAQEAPQEAPYGRRAYQLALQLADVLDGYQNYRADWLDDWAATRDRLNTAHGTPIAVPDAQQWQPALWRDLLQDLAQDTPADLRFRSRADVHEAFVKALQQLPDGVRPAGVPQRLVVFGVTSLPMQTVQALAALGRVCQVLMLVQNPCQYFWGHVVESRRPLATWSQHRQAHKPHLPLPSDSFTPAEQYQLHTDSNPLLAAWGKHGRDYLHLLDGFDDVARYRHQFQRIDVFVDPVTTAHEQQRPATVLERLQSDLLNLNPAPTTPEPLPPGDQSVTFVQTHSAQREVEVLHDRILAWLDAQPQLQPGDIMVMVPDMAAFAPHIHAVFGRFAAHTPRHIPYSVADTTPRTEPLVQALDVLLQLPQLRITRVEWMSLFEVAAVRARFGLDEADVAQLDDWLQQAGVRWGLDAPHRQTWGMDADLADAAQNSWLFGVQRLLLGYAMGTPDAHAAHTPAWQDTWPMAGVGGLDTRVVDGLLQWLRGIEWALNQLRQAHTPEQWVTLLQTLVAQFFKASTDAEVRLMERVMAPLETWLAECQLARLDAPLPLVVVREHWLGQLQQPAMHRRFFGGGVQFATLMPMRSIPFQVVCLLGMNDGDYPRSQTPRDFDLMGQAQLWRAGDRSRREDDRYLFLEALLSARQRLYISWQGQRATDHQDQPPSVLVAQLMDYLNASWTLEADTVSSSTLSPSSTSAKPTRAAFEAPLQPLHAFSPSYFQADSGWVTYATDWQQAHSPDAAALANSPSHVLATQTLATASTARPAPAATALPTDISLRQLARLLRQPVDVFVRERLRVQLDTPDEAAPEEEPFALDGLDTYLFSQTLARAPDPERALQQLHGSGRLALAGFGQAQQALLRQQREALWARLTPRLADWPHDLPAQSLDLSFTLASGDMHLHAEWQPEPQLWKTNAQRNAWLQVDVRPGSVLQGKRKTDSQRPRAETLTEVWLQHLVACASGTPTTSAQVGLDGWVQFNPLSADNAKAQLHHLVDAYAQAWQAPLPVARKTACAWLNAQRSQDPLPLQAARSKFEGGHMQSGEFPESTTLQRVFNSFDDLAPHLPDWAERLYGPMVDAAVLLPSGDAAHSEDTP
ncbi:exodeoxyribonuclease V subunit gamma [Limnohabitans sp. JirII-29]|nr:exodeoxyribonuclease V subunit gamma [Limnohabitans sp. JirII-29]